MIRAYNFLLRPTVRQEHALREMLADHYSLYNGALHERRGAWRHTSKTSIEYGHQSAQLKEIRAFDPERQGRWSFSSQQATLRRLDNAFQAFFRRVKLGEQPGYARSKGVGHFDTVTLPTVTAVGGTPPRTMRRPGSVSKASATSACISTGPSGAGSQRSR